MLTLSTKRDLKGPSCAKSVQPKKYLVYCQQFVMTSYSISIVHCNIAHNQLHPKYWSPSVPAKILVTFSYQFQPKQGKDGTKSLPALKNRDSGRCQKILNMIFIDKKTEKVQEEFIGILVTNIWQFDNIFTKEIQGTRQKLLSGFLPLRGYSWEFS